MSVVRTPKLRARGSRGRGGGATRPAKTATSGVGWSVPAKSCNPSKSEDFDPKKFLRRMDFFDERVKSLKGEVDEMDKVMEVNGITAALLQDYNHFIGHVQGRAAVIKQSMESLQERLRNNLESKYLERRGYEEIFNNLRATSGSADEAVSKAWKSVDVTKQLEVLAKAVLALEESRRLSEQAVLTAIEAAIAYENIREEMERLEGAWQEEKRQEEEAKREERENKERQKEEGEEIKRRENEEAEIKIKEEEEAKLQREKGDKEREEMENERHEREERERKEAEENAARGKIEEDEREWKRKKEEEERKEEEMKRTKMEEAEKNLQERRKKHLQEQEASELPPGFEARNIWNSAGSRWCVGRLHCGAGSEAHCSAAAQAEVEYELRAHDKVVGPAVAVAPLPEQERVFVAVAHWMPRLVSREPVLMCKLAADWLPVKSRETVYDDLPGMKFLLAEVTGACVLLPVSVLKTEVLVLPKRKCGEVKSEIDQKLSFASQRDTFRQPQTLRLQVNVVESALVDELRTKHADFRLLLAASSFFFLKWKTASKFHLPITVTIGCPPSAARWRRVEAAKAAKAALMKQPSRRELVQEMEERMKAEEEQKKRKSTTMSSWQRRGTWEEEADENAEPAKQVIKWHMGQYGSENDDDESENLYLLERQGEKWTVVLSGEQKEKLRERKLDLLEAKLDRPLNSMLLLRMRPRATADDASRTAETLSQMLTLSLAQILVSQSINDASNLTVQICTGKQKQNIQKKLEEDGEEELMITNRCEKEFFQLTEGSLLKIKFRRNITMTEDDETILCFNSLLPTYFNMTIAQENWRRQQDYNEYRGYLEIFRCSRNSPSTKKLCECLIPFPKMQRNVQPSRYDLRGRTGLNKMFVRELASRLGEEWIGVVSTLGLSQGRIQAIMQKNNDMQTVKELAIETWARSTPCGYEKYEPIRTAVRQNGRHDIAKEFPVALPEI